MVENLIVFRKTDDSSTEVDAAPAFNGTTKLKRYTETVYALDPTSQAGCRHYHSDLDIIAVQFKCCGKYYACYSCHLEMENHSVQRWTLEERDVQAILCRLCGNKLSIAEYLACGMLCVECGAPFNPGCKKHWELYFEVSLEERSHPRDVNHSKKPVNPLFPS